MTSSTDKIELLKALKSLRFDEKGLEWNMTIACPSDIRLINFSDSETMEEEIQSAGKLSTLDICRSAHPGGKPKILTSALVALQTEGLIKLFSIKSSAGKWSYDVLKVATYERLPSLSDADLSDMLSSYRLLTSSQQTQYNPQIDAVIRSLKIIESMLGITAERFFLNHPDKDYNFTTTEDSLSSPPRIVFDIVKSQVHALYDKIILERTVEREVCELFRSILGESPDPKSTLSDGDWDKLGKLIPRLDSSIWNFVESTLTLDDISRLNSLFIHNGIISEFLNQTELNKLLEHLGISNKSIPDTISRIVWTNIEVLKGLRRVKELLAEAPEKKIGLGFNLRDLTTVPSTLHDIELTWGILDVCLRKPDGSVYITISQACLEAALKASTRLLTLVMDGHGGQGQLFLGSHPTVFSITDRKVRDLISKIFAADTKKCIEHVILQSCTSGHLIDEHGLTMYEKKEARKGKARELYIVEDLGIDIFSLFQKIHSNYPFAALVVAEAWRHLGSKIAFTFSSNLINPSLALGEGNLGVEPKASRSDRINFGEVVPDSDLVSKSATLFFGRGHRKFERIKDRYTRKEDDLFDREEKKTDGSEPAH